MDIENLRLHCLNKKDVEESFPFGNDTLVFKVSGKIFLLAGLDSVPLQFNVKCDPTIAEELRGKYAAVKPGYHMNKKHWNTVICDSSISESKLLSWVDESYDLVVGSVSKIKRKKTGL